MTDETEWRGFSPRLQTARDLLAKLQHDFERLEADQNDDYAAWDFFVTAEHMRDWIDRPGGQSRPASSPLLKTVSHLANGGKHFELSPGRHSAVREVSQRGVFDAAYFDADAFDTARLTVQTIEPPAEINVVDLAARVLDYWVPEMTAKGHPE